MAYTVIGASVSPYVRKVRVVFAEKGLDYAHEPVNPFAPPEGFRDISPLGRIPVLRHDGRIINDSSVICDYLEHLHPEPPLVPRDPYERARALWIEEYMDGGFVPVSGPGVFRPLVLVPLLTGKEPDESAAKDAIEKGLPPLYDYLEKTLGHADFFVAGRFTIADIAVASPFVNLRHAGVAPDPARWPRLSAFVRRLHARPSFAKLIAEETPVFGKRSALLQA
jgi:glutathione S-transferase